MQNFYARFEVLLPNTIFILVGLVTLGQVFSRAVFGTSFPWGIEFGSYGLVWMCFLGLGFVHKKNEHIRIDFLSDLLEKKLSSNAKYYYQILKSLILLTFLIILIYLGVQLSIRSWNFRSSAMQMRQSWFYLSVPLGVLGYFGREFIVLKKIITSHHNKMNEN